MAELKNEFSWSWSRAEMFATCRRQYFFNYYGAWGGWDKRADPKTRATYVLKKLQTRHQWIGSTVHNALRWVLTTLRDKGAAPSEEATLRALGKRLQADYQDSGEGLYWEDPKNKRGLLEHEYDHLYVSDEDWSALFEKALAAVNTFFVSDVFATLQSLPREDWLEIDTLGSFEVDGVKVWVQLDCLFRRDGEIHVVDWKTGKANADSTREQLVLYAWYASQQQSVEAGRVIAAEINLGTGERVEHRFLESDFARVRERVATTVADMRALLDDAPNNRATEERFPLAESEAPCATCAFRRVCPRWAEADETEMA